MSENMMTKKSPPKDVAHALQVPAISQRIEDVMGKRAPQFCSALIQVSKQDHLKKCEPFTVIGAAMTAAAMDLSIDPNLGFAHIVPYKTQASFQMGYKGFIQLGLRTGQYAQMNDFKVNKEAFISFNPVTGDLKLDDEKLDEDAEDIVGYGFYFRLVNGFEKTVYWPKEKVEAHAKRYSQAYRKGYGPWKDNFDGMAAKTVIKLALSKYGILSTEMQMAITRDQSVITNDGDNEMVYPDNAEASGPVYDEPDIPDGDDEEKKDSPKKEEPKGLTDPADMDKTALKAEMKVHEKRPYFEDVLAPFMPPEGGDWTKHGVSMLREVVVEMRTAADNVQE